MLMFVDSSFRESIVLSMPLANERIEIGNCEKICANFCHVRETCGAVGVLG